MAGTLYLVATPLGNLEDITLRAIRVLKEVDLIACEDTRQSAKLLNHFGISKETVSCHEHNEAERSDQILARLQAGADVAMITDAGMPLISDPGYRLVAKAAAANVRIVPVPGPSAPIAAMAASGLPAAEFRFCGFLPSKPGARRKALEALAEQDCTLIFFESPFRIVDSLADIQAVYGERPVVVARELTKIHEEILRGTARHLRQTLSGRTSVKGEITLLVGGAGTEKAADGESSPVDAEQLRGEFSELVSAGASRMEAIKTISRRHSLPKRTVYSAVEADS